MSVLKFRSDAYSENNAQKPSVAAGAAAGTSPSGLSNTGRDEFGTISITSGTSPTTGTLFTLTFNKPYTIAPDAVLVSDNAGMDAYGSATTTTLTISAHSAPSGTVKVNYAVIGGA